MKGSVGLLKWMPNRSNHVPSSTTDLDTGDFLCVCAICVYIQVDPEFKFDSNNINDDLRDSDQVLSLHFFFLKMFIIIIYHNA